MTEIETWAAGERGEMCKRIAEALMGSAALAQPTAPAGDGVEGLRALLKDTEAARAQYEREECGYATVCMREYAFEMAAVNYVRNVIATRTPAGAAGDPAGEDVALRAAFFAGFWAWAGPDNLQEFDRWTADADAEWQEYATTLANRPASQAPAASAGGERVRQVIVISDGERWYGGQPNGIWRQTETATTWDFTDCIIVTPSSPRRAAVEAALTPTAQAQPVGREEIARVLYNHDARNLGPLWTWAQANAKERDEYLARADAILAARPVADGGAE